MTRKYYLDTCIWLDYWENRKDRFRHLGEWAFRLINKIVEERALIIFSQKVKEELEEKYSSEEIRDMISIVPPKNILFVEESTEQAKRIFRKMRVPFEDALHAIITKDEDAVLVTRDKHFLEFSDFIEVKKPEELI